MKIIFISVYYPAFLRSFYRRYGKSVRNINYQSHRKRILDELFGDSDFYSRGVKSNGHDADEIIANDKELQTKWAYENNLINYNKIDLFSNVPYLQILFKPLWVDQILNAQIEKISPDILYFHDIEYFSPAFLKKLKKKYFIVAQKASPIWRMDSFKEVDLVFSSFPHYVSRFRSLKINSEYLKLSFDKKVLAAIPKQKKIFNCTFVGGISRHHSGGVKVLSSVAAKTRIDVFGYGKNELDKDSSLYKYHHGEVWGKDMYKIIMQSRMTINRHINVSGKYANNLRLFEATGSGALLITDNKTNIGEFFKVGKEVVVYNNALELIRKIEFYSKNAAIREKIAQAGQKRTLRDHNYTIRMKQMLKILMKYYKKFDEHKEV